MMSRGRFGYIGKVSGTLLLAATALSAGPAGGARAAEVDADFSKYCREAFPGSAHQMRQQAWGPQHYCNQGGTLQGVDLARACEATTGRRGYRLSGTRVLCEDDGGQAADGKALTTRDFVDYCREKFPNSVHEQRAEAAGPVHYCRQPGASGGVTLQNIDLADACRSSGSGGEYDQRGGQVFCTAAAGNHRATAAAGGGRAEADRSDGAGDGRSDGSPDETETPADGDDDGAGKAATAGKAGLSGLWRLTDNSIRRFMTVRLALDGDRLTGTIVDIPEELARAVHNMDGLKPGDPFLHGRVKGDTITGTTRFGMAAASQIMTQPGNIKCRDFVAAIEEDPSRWMSFTLTRKGDMLTGRHEFRGLTLRDGSCALYKVPDTPPRLKDGQALFEMARVAAKAPEDEVAAKDDDCDEADAGDPPDWPESWIEHTRQYNAGRERTFDLVVPPEAVAGMSVEQLEAIVAAYPCPRLPGRARVLFRVAEGVEPIDGNYALVLTQINPGLAVRHLQDEVSLYQRWLPVRPDVPDEPEEVRRLGEARWQLSVARERVERLEALLSRARDLQQTAQDLHEQGLSSDEQVRAAGDAVSVLRYIVGQAQDRAGRLSWDEQGLEAALRRLREREGSGDGN